MARPRKHGAELPPHVHRVTAKGKTYFFYQPFRGTPREGARVPLPQDNQSVEFWDKLRQLAGTVPGYTGTLAAMIDAYLASPEFIPPDDGVKRKVLSESTRYTYKLHLNYSRMAIGKFPPDAIKPSAVLALRDEYADKPGTANMIVRALSACYEWGRLRDYAMNNPAKGVPTFELGEHKQWPEPMVDLLLGSATPLLKRFTLITLYTGQRISDVCGMTTDDIADNEIRVRQKKTGKELWIPLHATLQAELKGVDGPLLANGKGGAFSSGTLRDIWDAELGGETLKPIKAAGLVPHGLCKNAHSRLREAGLSTDQIQAITGRSPKMVEYYSKGADQRLRARAGMAKLAENDAQKVLQTLEESEQKQSAI
ncbi:integrase [Aminobacter sp. Y103A]|uniref:tyrosine-type recombinase/integrase n=1 Tax=Aminobacter sp. Y103A TaxID=1870862 RepID=UPI002573BC0D|nr:tyrosine-type recombinase/integrase [Aminobacter sp. SS-2016]BBD37017.1 integrase [Aminobacter sp. SS-2016]